MDLTWSSKASRICFTLTAKTDASIREPADSVSRPFLWVGAGPLDDFRTVANEKV